MKRREFIQLTGLTGMGRFLPAAITLGTGFMGGCADAEPQIHSEEFRTLTLDLLKDWCDGMIKVQIHDPEDPSVHGALGCPACSHIHGRCMDVVFPFLYMAQETGEEKYKEAAILVMEWAENNVSQPDGSWTVIPNPKSWKGISVFGAIALAEALYYHGDVLDPETRQRFMDRLAKAATYIHDTFTISFTNINYGATAIYGLHLFGKVLDNSVYQQRSKELAHDVKAYFTKSDHLLFGEVKPLSDQLSEKGLHGVDLGYNVEESLNSLVMYGLEAGDEELLDILTKSLNSHLEFMLPDGGWDNSWGTRQYKWTYWGSRTCDGSQPAFAMMADRNPAFGTAAVLNTQLLRRCTADGLLFGGMHYVSHDVPPCVHHTFAHAKPLATLLNGWDHLPVIQPSAPLPRQEADGIRQFEDLDLMLFARGNWRGTLTTNDVVYKKGTYQQATGGSVSVLYHQKVGLLLSASMAIYKLVEKNNQQVAPGEDIALTPRIETYSDGIWYTNLFDREAMFESSDIDGIVEARTSVQLKNKDEEVVSSTASDVDVIYRCSEKSFQVEVSVQGEITEETAFVLPVVSQADEEVTQQDPHEIQIRKPDGIVMVRSDVPLNIKEMPRSRTFNMVPGVEAIPVIAAFPDGITRLEITIEIA